MDTCRSNGLLSIGQFALVGALIWCWCVWGGAATVAAPSEERQNADRLLPVDCLLPPQVHQLGTGISYLAPRRPIKTTGSVCAIRGGEYVAYDRANYATALKVWLPPAQAGDKAAQTYVGEIYEKGLGIAPDYAAAASWYKKAADQGYSRALINLGFLYERGLGVPKDPATALKLYRKAAGIEGTINLEGQPASASKEELDKLRKELEQTRQELERARRLLDQERLKSGAEIERLTQQKLHASAVGNDEESRRLESLLKERETELEKRRQQVAQFEQANQDYKSRIERMEGESASLRQELGQAKEQLAQSQREIEGKKNVAAAAQGRLEATQQEIAREKSAGVPADSERIKSLEAELQQRKSEFEQQKQDITRLETDVANYKATVAMLEAGSPPATQPLAIAPPSIQIIDPPIVITRDTATVKVRTGLNVRTVVGRVTAPAGLLSFTANDVPQNVDLDGMFKTGVELSGGRTRVTMVAVDRQGKRAQLEFFLEEDATIGKAPVIVPPKPSKPDLPLGKYYALVIGDQKYQSPKLGQLDTPEADAMEIAALLKDRYSFSVTLLLNGTRWQILEEINKMRALLTENDNLLIYYAGHGQLDRVNFLANWLPVDADPDSTANWIASSTLTENLNMMSAKHILVVADSCYSGAMTRSSIGQLQPGLSDEARLVWLKSIAESPSRTVLTSGGVSPVLDSGGAKHSVFAQIFIDVLSENQDVLPGKQLSDVISARVLDRARTMNFQQRPEYAPIRFAGGESGDFIFVPKI